MNKRDVWFNVGIGVLLTLCVIALACLCIAFVLTLKGMQ